MFLQAPDQYQLLCDRPELIESAVEEILRYESPLQIGNRLTSTSTEIGGVQIPAGTYIHTSIAGANRDPAIFTDPKIHVCLGATLARYEGKIAFRKLIERFPNIVAAGTPERMPLARFRGYSDLPVRF